MEDSKGSNYQIHKGKSRFMTCFFFYLLGIILSCYALSNTLIILIESGRFYAKSKSKRRGEYPPKTGRTV